MNGRSLHYALFRCFFFIFISFHFTMLMRKAFSAVKLTRVEKENGKPSKLVSGHFFSGIFFSVYFLLLWFCYCSLAVVFIIVIIAMIVIIT